MPYPNPAIRAVIKGTLAGGEIFTYSFGLMAPSTLSQSDLNTCAINVGTATANNLLTSAVQAFFSSQTSFDQVTCYQYTGGSTASLVSAVAPIGKAGSASASPTPNQCAIVVTTQTGLPGRSNRGRFYLPGPSVGILGAGQITAANAQTLASAAADMFNALGALPAPGPFHGGVLSVRQSAIRRVTQVRVDTRLDVQRRRADKQTVTASKTATVT